ncbi:MAG TPA: periplasmic heavy metal sensor [Gemmatimonadales bacterium]|jgi:Spy/CpxP family protein refolding chaperone|nr:periplasmic heavy metal sensor [Gemmatimonadales bacterium]
MASRGRAAALLALVFLAGALAGAGAWALRRGGSHGDHPRGDFVEHLAHHLDLTPAQRDSVAAILERRRRSMDSLWQEVGPRFETLRVTVRSEIRSQLTPDQQRKFADMNKRADSIRAQGGSHGPR